MGTLVLEPHTLGFLSIDVFVTAGLLEDWSMLLKGSVGTCKTSSRFVHHRRHEVGVDVWLTLGYGGWQRSERILVSHTASFVIMLRGRLNVTSPVLSCVLCYPYKIVGRIPKKV